MGDACSQNMDLTSGQSSRWVGVAEMNLAVERTAGLVVLAESSGHSVFKDYFRCILLAGDQALGLSFKYGCFTYFLL